MARKVTLSEADKLRVLESLRRHNGCRTDAAKDLGISTFRLSLRLAKIPASEIPPSSRGRRRKPDLAFSEDAAPQPTSTESPESPASPNILPPPRRIKTQRPLRNGLGSLFDALPDRVQNVPDSLWHDYRHEQSDEARNALIVAYLPMAKATELKQRRLGKIPRWLSSDEFIGIAVDGLSEAIRTFDPSRGFKFATWAQPKIWYRVVDHVRSYNPYSRNVMKDAKVLATFRADFSKKHRRQPAAEECREALGFGLEKYEMAVRAYVEDMSLDRSFMPSDDSHHEVTPADSVQGKEPSPEQEINRRMYAERILRGLMIEEKIVVYLYHFKSMTMKNIGEALDLSESRISQMHANAIDSIRERFNATEEFELLRA